MPEKINFSRRQIRRTRTRRGESISGHPPIHAPHIPSHHPVSHHKEPVLREVDRELHRHSRHAPERTIFDASILSGDIETAKSQIKNNIVAVIQKKEADWPLFAKLLEATQSRTHAEQPLTPVIDTLDHHVVLLGKAVLGKQIRNGKINAELHQASLVAVQAKHDGFSVIEKILSVNFTTGEVTNVQGEPAGLRTLEIAGNILAQMHAPISPAQ